MNWQQLEPLPTTWYAEYEAIVGEHVMIICYDPARERQRQPSWVLTTMPADFLDMMKTDMASKDRTELLTDDPRTDVRRYLWNGDLSGEIEGTFTLLQDAKNYAERMAAPAGTTG